MLLFSLEDAGLCSFIQEAPLKDYLQAQGFFDVYPPWRMTLHDIMTFLVKLIMTRELYFKENPFIVKCDTSMSKALGAEALYISDLLWAVGGQIRFRNGLMPSAKVTPLFTWCTGESWIEQVHDRSLPNLNLTLKDLSCFSSLVKVGLFDIFSPSKFTIAATANYLALKCFQTSIAISGLEGNQIFILPDSTLSHIFGVRVLAKAQIFKLLLHYLLCAGKRLKILSDSASR